MPGPAPLASRHYSSALLALLNPWEVYTQVKAESMEKFYKITDLASNTLKTLQLLNVDQYHPLLAVVVNSKKVHESLTIVKYFGKCNQSKGLLDSFFDARAFKKCWNTYSLCDLTDQKIRDTVKHSIFPILYPTSDQNDPAWSNPLARTDGLPGGDRIKLGLHRVKILVLTTGAALQTYLIASKIFFPELFKRVTPQLIQTVGLTATRIGGQNAGAAAKVITNFGASAAKNWCFMIFLAFEAYQGWHYYQEAASNTDRAKEIDLGLKFAANAGKVVILASLTIFNAPTAVVIGISLVVCWIDLSEVYQKSLIDSEKAMVLSNSLQTQTHVLAETQSELQRYKDQYGKLEDT